MAENLKLKILSLGTHHYILQSRKCFCMAFADNFLEMGAGFVGFLVYLSLNKLCMASEAV